MDMEINPLKKTSAKSQVLEQQQDVSDVGKSLDGFSLDSREILFQQQQAEFPVLEPFSSDNYSQIDHEISLGYDIISRYPSSCEDVAAMNCMTIEGTENISESVELQRSFSLNSLSENIEPGKESPSAPDLSDDLHIDMNVISEKNKYYPDILSQVSCLTTEKESAKLLKPFTEVEMANFYYNSELRNHEAFVANFIEAELKSRNVVDHPLHKLLSEYVTCRDNLCKNQLSFDSLMEDFKTCRDQIWTLTTSSLTEYGECQDGNPVSASYQYSVAHFNHYIYQTFIRRTQDIGVLVIESYVSNIFAEKLCQRKIQHYIDSICYTFSFLSPHSPLLLFNESEPRGPYGTDLRTYIHVLKNAISVLFAIQRRPTKDDEFIAETRQWLDKLISVLLRIATPSDHLFILHHVLRCPAGAGKWAAKFIQPPVPMKDKLNQFYIDHLITSVAAILLPIHSRDLFLQQMVTSYEENGMWVIVDSDGEDSDDSTTSKTSLKETDLIAFLNQMPFSSIFRQVILVSHWNGEDDYDINTITDRDILRSIAIGTLLVNLFEKGIANCSGTSYKQFCKLLSRLIEHTAHYISEHFEIFRTTYAKRSVVDTEMFNRLQIEHDEFILRIVNTLYVSPERIGWQYLATLPFGTITQHTAWRIYQYLIHINPKNIVIMSDEFMETLVQLPDNDIYYFLTTITNMAMGRRKVKDEYLFIQSVTLQLFKVGFVNAPVREKCMKSARILLVNVTGKFPELISDIISALKKDFVLVGKYALYLFKELPISAWKPNIVDTLTFSDWLLSNSLQTWENNLARYILSHLNWSTDGTETDLFLPRNYHCQIAILTVKTVYLYADQIAPTKSTAILTQSVRQVSSMVRNQTPEQILEKWAWEMLSKLKLHFIDQPAQTVRRIFSDLTICAEIPDINSNTENMRVLSEGLKENNSIACYAALLMSNLGHSIPLICETCWDYCDVLLSSYKYNQVLHVLQLTLPFFFDSIDSLVNQEKFVKVVAKLLVADQTYMKMARNLIMTDFPGQILKQFAALIQYQVDNFSRYCQPNSYQVIEMWLKILTIIWNEHCLSAAFLIDKISVLALFDESIRQLLLKTLSDLIRDRSSSRPAANSLTSIVSWLSYGTSTDTSTVPISLLPRNSQSITKSPYFVYFALFLEELFIQNKTGLWPEILKILANSIGKANIDSATKKACANLKLCAIPSGLLGIYRWSQYALELPCDHPMQSLYWQRFFRLYLHRVPGNNSTVCVGSKFFEGTINYNYFKKIKKKLEDCVACLNSKVDETEFQQPLFDSLIQLYKSYLLWLEEPRLQEPDVFLPALPATFNVNKLSDIMNGEETIWLEYLDFDAVQSEQKELIIEWTKTLCRVVSSFSNRVTILPVENVIQNMLDRLNTYDKKLSPPALFITHSVVPQIPLDKFLDKSQLLTILADHLQVISQYTKCYSVEKDEQDKEAKSLVEAYRYLYSESELEVKLYAACDTTSPRHKRKVVNSIHCAGPAAIILQIREGKLNKTVKHAAEKSDMGFQRLLKHNLTSPPLQFLVACIVIELTVDTLIKEILECKQTGDISLSKTLHEVGIALFYRLIMIYDTSVSEYFPTKTLFKKLIDRLGETCIDRIENECSNLLQTTLDKPRLSSLLVPHFTPYVISASLFVRLYGKVAANISPSNVDFILNLMEKFEVKLCLHEKRPKLADRSQLIEIISKSLNGMGSQPIKSLIPVHKILRKDLCEILVFEFPEHYGEILEVVLRNSAEEKFSCDVWFDVLNSLIICSSKAFVGENYTILRPGLTVLQMRDIARRYASDIRMLSMQELVETTNMLGQNFLKERLRYGLYGLYPRYKIYMEPIIALHSMIGHAVVAKMLHVYRTALADQICERVWPYLQNLFTPWVSPFFTGNLQEQPETWIQQLNDDRSILLPWTKIDSDMQLANKMMATFTECLRFILDALPASTVILSNVCQWYVTQFAHSAVKEHILTTVQNNLISLPWSRFIPSIQDIESLMKVVEQYLPVCHSFIGSVFIEIPWTMVVQQDNPQIAVKIHVILLNLLIKLANEPTLRQSNKVVALLQDAQQFHWNLVDTTCYEEVLHWFVMSYDSRVLLMVSDEECAIDIAAFDLLQIAAGYVNRSAHQHPTTSRKRQMFVKAYVKLNLQLANRYKAVLANHQQGMENSLTKMLDKIESVLTTSVEKHQKECVDVLTELLVLLNQPTGSILSKLMIQVLVNWLSHRGANSCVLQGLLRISNAVINDFTHRGIILEACLTAWFKNSAGFDECNWNTALSIIPSIIVSHPRIEDALVANNHVLTLYAVTIKNSDDKSVVTFNKLIQWIVSLKPSSDNESKLAILWSLVFRYGKQNWTEMAISLSKLCAYFQEILNIKSGWGLFGVIGISKQHVPSVKCKVLCQALISFIEVKMNEEKSNSLENAMEEGNDADQGSTALVNPIHTKSVTGLENLLNDKHYNEHRITIETALRLVTSKNVTISNGEQFIITLAKLLYAETFIHAFQIEEL